MLSFDGARGLKTIRTLPQDIHTENEARRKLWLSITEDTDGNKKPVVVSKCPFLVFGFEEGLQET